MENSENSTMQNSQEASSNPLGNSSPKKVPLDKNVIIASAIVLVLIIVGVTAVFNRDKIKSLFSKNSDISMPNPEDGTAVSVPTEDYIEEKKKEIESSDREKSFLATLELADFYMVSDNVPGAEELMNGISTSGFSDEDYFRYYNVMARLANAMSDSKKSEEYTTLALDYRARLQPNY